MTKQSDVNVVLAAVDAEIEKKQFDGIIEGLESSPYLNKPNNENNVSHWIIAKSGSRWLVYEDHEQNGTTKPEGFVRASFRTLKEADTFCELLAKAFHYGWNVQLNVHRTKSNSVSIRAWGFAN